MLTGTARRTIRTGEEDGERVDADEGDVEQQPGDPGRDTRRPCAVPEIAAPSAYVAEEDAPSPLRGPSAPLPSAVAAAGASANATEATASETAEEQQGAAAQSAATVLQWRCGSGRS
eukprot:11595447-Alexandrium_andersonii.AAC.1